MVSSSIRPRDPHSAEASPWIRGVVLGASGLTAAVLLLVTLHQPHRPHRGGAPVAKVDGQDPVVVPTDRETVVVAETLRQGTTAYVELMQSLASAMPVSQPTPSDERLDVVASASPVNRAVRGSNEALRTASEGLRAGVEPITSSALDAFGFLWRPGSTTAADPST